MRTLVVLIGLAIVRPEAAAQTPPPPAASPGTVTLSLAEYNRLLDLGDRPESSPAPLTQSVVATADLRVRVEAGTARGVFTVAGEVLVDGIAVVPLIGSATLVEATMNGRPLPLRSDTGRYQALIEGPGPFAVALGWGAPVVQAAGRASFVLPVTSASATRATIDLPGDQADVQVSHGLVTGRTVANERTLVDVTLDPGSGASISWSMRESTQLSPTRDVRASAEVLTLVTVGDSDVRVASLVDLTVLQGELRTLAVQLPAGFELTGVSGGSIATSAASGNSLTLTFGDSTSRSHQFLVTLERPHGGGSFAVETGVLTMPAVQREHGEIAVEGVGTLELAAEARDGAHRMDVREVSASLQALASQPLLSAFRYQRAGPVSPTLALGVKRFADAGVLAAVAERAVATTLVTGEGRALTEIKLQVQNRAQPFLKVLLPPGASMVSVEVAGESAKPVSGSDGTRVPLLRPGFRPTGTYEVSFVYLHAGTPFARKGDIAMALPRLDLPIGIVNWEVFVPERYSAHAIDGNAIDVQRFTKTLGGGGALAGAATAVVGKSSDKPGASLTGVQEVVGARAQSPPTDAAFEPIQPSQNVVNLQRRTSGVLPIRVDVPRAGTSHRFVKPLVIDQETTVTLRYRRR